MCPADRLATDLNCTANDVEVASVDVLNNVTTCVSGEQVSLHLRANLHANSQKRYNVGIFMAEDGKTTLLTASNGGSGVCSTFGLPTSPLPFASLDSNVCGDFDSTGLAQGQTTPLDLGTVNVTCTPDPEGYLDIPTIVTWETNADTAGCQSPPEAWFVPENKSKCESGISQRIPVQVLGRIDVVKQTVPDGSAGNFAFSASGPGVSPTSFQLADGQTQTVATAPLGAAAQAYVISEQQLAGWSSTAQIDCRDLDGDIAPFVVVDEANRTLTANMSANFNRVTCTFTNTQQASITINKSAVGDNGTFDFTGSPTLGAFAITTAGGAGQAAFSDLAPGTYSVSEAIPAGWDLTGLSCVDPTNDSSVNSANATATIALGAGEHVECTYTDTRRGQITVVKNTVGGNDTFNFSGPPTAQNPSGAFQITTSANTGQVVLPDLVPGSYSVVESVPAGWDLSGLVCDDPTSNSSGNLGTATANVNVGPGENVVCTFTDTQRGAIIVQKQVNGTDATFDFTGSQAFSIVTAGGFGQNATAFATVAPGQYTITESALAHYSLSGLICADPTVNSATDIGTRTATVNLGAGETVVCTFTNTQLATLTIIKHAVPHIAQPNTQSFAFTATGPGLADFALSDDGTNPNSTTFSDLSPGASYSVTEAAVAAWPLASLTCTDQSDPNPANRSAIDLAGYAVAPNLQPGETLRCVFTNVRNDNGAITITKRTIGTLAANTGGTFDFTNSGGIDGSQTNPLAFSITTTVQNPQQSRSLTQLAANVYMISETPLAGWDLAQPECVVTAGSNTSFTYTATSATITLGTTDGNVDGAACMFTNTHRSGITIVKESTPNDPQDFAFTTTGGLSPSVFSLDDDSDPTLANTQPFDSIVPGIYTVSEQGAAGWKLTAIACSGGSSITTDVATGVASIDLKAGESVTCTYRNAKNGSISIGKVAQGGTGSDQFAFSAAPGLAGFNLADGGTKTFSVDAGGYVFSELVPAGWDLTNIVCTGGSVTFTGATTNATGGFEAGDTTVNITIASGDTVSCTYTDIRRAGITIVKNAIGGDGVFAFTGTQAFQIVTSGGSGQDAGTFASVAPGIYPVTESLPAGWQLTALACTNGSATSLATATATVQVAAGENVTCTFTNTRLGAIRIVKRIESDESGPFTFTAPAALAPSGTFQLAPDVASAEAVQEFQNVAAGTYAVSEVVPAGWKLLSISCVDPTSDTAVNVASATATIHLSAGETVECTFDDTQLSSITVSVVSTGGTGIFPFASTNLGANSFSLATPAAGAKASRVSANLPPGTYTADGLGLAGWKFDGLVCHAESGETYWMITGAHVSITIPHGEVIECTYYYSLIPAPPPPVQLPMLSPWLYGLIGLMLIAIGGTRLRARI